MSQDAKEIEVGEGLDLGAIAARHTKARAWLNGKPVPEPLADLIANDAPHLLAEVERLRSALRERHTEGQAVEGVVVQCFADREQAAFFATADGYRLTIYRERDTDRDEAPVTLTIPPIRTSGGGK